VSPAGSADTAASKSGAAAVLSFKLLSFFCPFIFQFFGYIRQSVPYNFSEFCSVV